MRERKPLVINTSPLLALIAARGPLDWLRDLYSEVLVPLEVADELLPGGIDRFGVSEFQAAGWLTRLSDLTPLPPHLQHALDSGEAAVIASALHRKIRTVCIDELVGRRIARLYGLELTGSIGVLVRARLEGQEFSMKEAVIRMQEHGIRLSEQVIAFALERTGE